MPKKKRPEEKPEEQFKRFQEAAKDKGVDEREAEKAFGDLTRKDPAKVRPLRP